MVVCFGGRSSPEFEYSSTIKNGLTFTHNTKHGRVRYKFYYKLIQSIPHSRWDPISLTGLFVKWGVIPFIFIYIKYHYYPYVYHQCMSNKHQYIETFYIFQFLFCLAKVII